MHIIFRNLYPPKKSTEEIIFSLSSVNIYIYSVYNRVPYPVSFHFCSFVALGLGLRVGLESVVVLLHFFASGLS